MAKVNVTDSGRFLDGYSNVLGAVSVIKSAASELDNDVLLAVYHHAQKTAEFVGDAMGAGATDEVKADAEVRVGCLRALVEKINDAGTGGLDSQLLYAAAVLLDLAGAQLSEELYASASVAAA